MAKTNPDMEEKTKPDINIGGDGKGDPREIPEGMKQILSAGMLGGLTSTKEIPSAISKLVDPGEEVLKILMRTKFPNSQKRLAACHILAQGMEFTDPVAIRELFYNLAATVSEGGEGREQLVAAVIGDRNVREGGMRGVGNWIREKAGFGSGQGQ